MKLDTAFRLSSYLTLALATACLGFAEEAFLPWMPPALIPAGLLILIAYLLEGRLAQTHRSANIMGLLIFGATAWWLWYQLSKPHDDLKVIIPWPAILLPFLGPILMAVGLAKLFRPKQVADYWGIHCIGLMEVALACVLTGDAIFGFYLLAYLACGLWSLMLFSLYREELAARTQARSASKGSADPSRTQARSASEGTADPSLALRACEVLPGGPEVLVSARVPWSLLGLGRAAGLALPAAFFGVLFFLVTPHPGDTEWDPYTLSVGGVTSAYSEGIDLNRSGDIDLSNRVAMEVYVEDANGRPKLDLSPEQLWRGATMEYYDTGRWSSRTHTQSKQPLKNGVPQNMIKQRQLPRLGPDQFFVTFSLDPRLAGGLFLADPVVLPEDEQGLLPYNAGSDEQQVPLFYIKDNTLAPMPIMPGAGRFHYRQVTMPAREAGLGQPFKADGRDRKDYLSEFHVHRLVTWTENLLRRLISEKKLAPEDFRQINENRPGVNIQLRANRLIARNREKVARVLSDYLANSGEYTYTLSLKREDLKIDPSEDFLLNVKQGHCERFATGLALMLRAAGIPSRLVKGYRGAESLQEQGKEGHYVVRMSHAHAWVEVLVYRRGPDNQIRWHWLTLDPTPSLEAQTEGMNWLALWVDRSTQDFRKYWRTYVLEYNLEQQSETASMLWRQVGQGQGLQGTWNWAKAGPLVSDFWLDPRPWLLVGVVVALGIWWRRRRQTPNLTPPETDWVSAVGFYARLLAVLARHFGLAPRPEQTPLEFAETAGRVLHQGEDTSALAELPREVARLFYRVRFGGWPVDSDDSRQLDRRVEELERILAQRGPEPVDRLRV